MYFYNKMNGQEPAGIVQNILSMPAIKSYMLIAQSVKNLPVTQETQVRFLGREDPLQKEMAKPTPVFLPGESHGQKSLTC